ncbi:MerR family transcriptional regulator [Nocardia sp. NPDC019395]|uniref:helix-turn-helix domain-containing protein n=1 Tax=Nocardia sp. NPDC019395 TaxID=3154686 RepID=UPI0033C634A0
MTYITYPSNVVSIGEASRRTGIPVRTVRFYCDEGILATRRTTGGHRVFTPDDLDRLLLIRRFRALGLGLPAIVGMLADPRAVPAALAAERVAVEAEIGALTWRHAVLVAIEQADGNDRPLVLTRLAEVADRGAARTALIDFWRRILTPMPAAMFDDFVEMDIPPIPAEPSPRHVLAFAELVQLARSPELAVVVSRQLWGADDPAIRSKPALIEGLAPAYTAVANRIAAADPPDSGPELDMYIAAHAAARAGRDTPGFRRRLARGVPVADRTATRYWTLTAEVLGTPSTTGAIQHWLDTALARSLEPVSGPVHRPG